MNECIIVFDGWGLTCSKSNIGEKEENPINSPGWLPSRAAAWLERSVRMQVQ